MKRKILVGLFLLVSMLVIAKTITHDVKSNSLNAHIASEGPLIIRSEVNAAQGPNHRWRRGDIVKLRQNGRTSKYRYESSGNFTLRYTGSSTGGGGGSGSNRIGGGGNGGLTGGSSITGGGLGNTTNTNLNGEGQNGNCEPWTLSVDCGPAGS